METSSIAYILYDSHGKPMPIKLDASNKEIPEEAASFAKACQDIKTGAIKHYVRIVSSGPDAGHLWNPNSIYDSFNGRRRFDREKGKERLEYKKVPEEAFLLYLKFLSTRNRAYYVNAERLIK